MIICILFIFGVPQKIYYALKKRGNIVKEVIS